MQCHVFVGSCLTNEIFLANCSLREEGGSSWVYRPMVKGGHGPTI